MAAYVAHVPMVVWRAYAGEVVTNNDVVTRATILAWIAVADIKGNRAIHTSTTWGSERVGAWDIQSYKRRPDTTY